MPKTFAKIFFIWILWFQIQFHEGKRNLSKRIWNGWMSQPNAYPFAVAVWHLQDGFICGGALISYQHVLTAGHCVDKPNALKTIYIQVGVYRLTDPPEHMSKLQKITLHPLYRRGHFVDEHDVAIIKAPVPFRPHIRIKPISFTQNPDAYPMAGTVLKLTGWGMKNQTEFTDVRLEGEFIVITLHQCHTKMHQLMNVTKAYICTEQPSFAVCPFDSGSPLFHITSGVAYLDGIAIVGNTHCKDDHMGNLAVFVNVNFFRSWVMANM